MDEERELLAPSAPTSINGIQLFKLFAVEIISKSFYAILLIYCVTILTIRQSLSWNSILLLESLLITTIIIRHKVTSKTLPVLLARELTVDIANEESRSQNFLLSRAAAVEAIKPALENKDLWLSAVCIFGTWIVAKALETFEMLGSLGSFANDASVAFFLGLSFPIVASILGKKTSTENFVYRFSFAGFIYFLFLLSYLPHGLGFQFAGWLNASLWDASMLTSVTPQFAMRLLCSTLVFTALVTTFRQPIVRLCAGYQHFTKRAIVFKESPLDAFRATTQAKALKIELPDQHPHINSAISTGIWIFAIYALLFAGVIFCPGVLGDTIRGFLQDSLEDANLDGNILHNFGLLTFLASVIAAYATIPVAIMSCSFLPTKKTNYVLVSNDGILTPCAKKTLFGISPFLPWSELNSITLENKDIQSGSYLKLSFDHASPLTIKISDTKKDSVTLLLNAADEYSKKCFIEQAVLDLHRQYIDETKSSTHAEIKRFSSTVFSPLKQTDRLNGNYRIVRKLAGKSLAAVYLARNAQSELCVIKEFVLPEDSKARQRLDISFSRECRLLKQIHNPAIAQVLEFFEEGNAKYLVLEHISGIDLRTLISKGGARNEATVTRWALSIASIMSDLHSHEPAILHRDLTPDNLMLSEDGQIKLIDFGASHQFIEGITGTLIGKQCYIAPEQLRGQPQTVSDIYSYGCTLYFFLTGQDPGALQQSNVLGAGITVSSRLNELILSCTEFEPQNRLRSFAEISEYLAQPAVAKFPLIDPVIEPIVETSYGI